VVDRVPEEVGVRDEVGVEDREELPLAFGVAAASAPALYPRRSVRCT